MPIGAVPSGHNIKFNAMRRTNQSTPEGPAIRRMSNTVPGVGQLSHWSLVRDGANLTQEYYGISEGKEIDRQGRLIEVINNDTHENIATVKIKRGSIVYVVNKETGNIVEISNPTKKQSYISRFNIDTFPRTRATEYDITEVGFWTVFGNYWPPVKFNDDHFSRQELEHEVGGLLKPLGEKKIDDDSQQDQHGQEHQGDQSSQPQDEEIKSVQTEINPVTIEKEQKSSSSSIDDSIRSQIHIEPFTPPEND